jgi:hypothetical protein
MINDASPGKYSKWIFELYAHGGGMLECCRYTKPASTTSFAARDPSFC